MKKIIFCLVIMLLPTIIEAQDVVEERKSYGGTVVRGAHVRPTLINPILTTQGPSMFLLDLIFNRLVRINAEGEMEPDLAESWDISPNGLVYTFHLRKGVQFHDSRECTAVDVKFTYDKLVDPEVDSPFKSHFQLVKSFEAVDMHTFRITLKKPSAPFIYQLTREIVPRHLLERADLRNCSFNFNPIGTGPFRFERWIDDNQIILTHNSRYYEGMPYLNKIIVKSYTTSRDVWTALMRGEVDFALCIEREDYEIAKDDPAFKVYAVPTDGYYAIFYNLNNAILADKRIRRAIAYGVDRRGLIKRVAHGYGLECIGPFYPESLGFNPDVKPFEYNPEKSIALLAEADWQDEDGDGVLEKDEEELEIRVLVDSRNDIYKRIIMDIRQQLQEIGIKIKVQLYDDDSMLTEEFLRQNKPQANLKFFAGGLDPDHALEQWSPEFKKAGRLWVYRNKEVERLLERGKVTHNKKKREEIYQEIHKFIYEDQPGCFLYLPFLFHAISSKFENTDEFFTLNMPTYTIKDWYLKKSRE